MKGETYNSANGGSYFQAGKVKQPVSYTHLDVYKRQRLKHAFVGNEAWVLSYREECFDQLGLNSPSRRGLNSFLSLNLGACSPSPSFFSSPLSLIHIFPVYHPEVRAGVLL